MFWCPTSKSLFALWLQSINLGGTESLLIESIKQTMQFRSVLAVPDKFTVILKNHLNCKNVLKENRTNWIERCIPRWSRRP